MDSVSAVAGYFGRVIAAAVTPSKVGVSSCSLLVDLKHPSHSDSNGILKACPKGAGFNGAERSKESQR